MEITLFTVVCTLDWPFVLNTKTLKTCKLSNDDYNTTAGKEKHEYVNPSPFFSHFEKSLPFAVQFGYSKFQRRSWMYDQDHWFFTAGGKNELDILYLCNLIT